MSVLFVVVPPDGLPLVWRMRRRAAAAARFIEHRDVRNARAQRRSVDLICLGIDNGRFRVAAILWTVRSWGQRNPQGKRDDDRL